MDSASIEYASSAGADWYELQFGSGSGQFCEAEREEFAEYCGAYARALDSLDFQLSAVWRAFEDHVSSRES